MSRPRHPTAGACKVRRYPEPCDTVVPVCTPHPYTIPPSAYVFGGGSFCEPGKCYAESRVWTWRERALRAAAAYACKGMRWLPVSRHVGDGPFCSLRVEHLHPAVQAAWTGRCVP